MAKPRRRKPNATGRNETESFIRLHRGVTTSAAWLSLSCEARCLVLLVWGRHTGNNNGRIPLSHREARASLKIGNGKVVQAFKDAQQRGFIVQRQGASFNWKSGAGEGKSAEWEITTEECNGQPAKRLYKNFFTAPAPGTERLPPQEPLLTKSSRKAPERLLPQEPIPPNSVNIGSRPGCTSISIQDGREGDAQRGPQEPGASVAAQTEEGLGDLEADRRRHELDQMARFLARPRSAS